MNSAFANTPATLPRNSFASQWRARIVRFLFSPDTGEWLGILRIGLGLEVALYSLSLRADWSHMFARSSTGFLNREFTEDRKSVV